MNTEIFIENRRLDISADISTLLNFAIDDIKDFASRSTTWSKTIVLPGTANNNKLFGHIFQIGQSNDHSPDLDNVNYNFNAAKAADCIIFQDQMQTFKGVLRLMQINITKGQIEYEVAVFGEIAGLNVSLNGGLLEDLDFSAYDMIYNASGITGSWANTSGVGVYFPLIDYGTYSTAKDDWDIRTFRPALHVREYIDKMLTAAGFRWSSALFDTPRFKTLIVPHNQKDIYIEASEYLNANATGTQTINQTTSDKKINFADVITNVSFTITTNDTFQYTDASTITPTVTVNLTLTFIVGPLRIGLFRLRGATQTNIANAAATASVSFSAQVELQQNDYIYILAYNYTGGPGGVGQTLTVNAGSLLVAPSAGVNIPISPGETIVVNNTIPRNVRQIDFISGIIKLFNLYCYESLTDSRLIRFTPYVDFYSPNVYPQSITINKTNFGTSTDGTGASTSLSLVAGDLYILIIESNCVSDIPNIPTIIINANTNTQFSTKTFNTIGTPRNRITAFRFVASATASESTNIDFGGQTQTGFAATLYQITGGITTGTDGADGIMQIATNSADATANPSINMAAIVGSRNAVIAGFANDVPTPFGGVAEAGWTTDVNGGHDAGGLFTMHRLATTDNTPTVTASASDWAGIAIEIKSGSSETIDWTYKLNRDKTLKIRPMSELTAKKYEFKFKSDSDFFNEAYRKRYGQGYGDYVFDSQFEFAESNKSFEIVFSATPLVGYTGEDKVFPTIFKSSNGIEERIDSNIRIMQSKKITGVTSWDIKDGVTVLSSQTDYGYAGHFDDPDAPSNDLNFGALRELFFTLASGDLTVTQFNVYWSSYMAEITDKDSKLLSAWFYLTAKDILNLDFSKKIFIDGVLFRLNAIKDYNVSNISDCECELLKVNYLIY